MGTPNYQEGAPAKPNAQAIIEAVERLANPLIQHIFADPIEDGPASLGSYVILPSGKKIESLKPIIDQFRTKPERRTGTATLTDENDFIRHVTRFKADATVIFADRTESSPSLLAVYDYHPAGPDNTAAAFGKHRARYSFPLSQEWEEWTGKDGIPMDATGFAEFLEDRIPDVLAIDLARAEDLRAFADLVGGTFASPSKMLELSRSLEINAAVGVKQAQRLSSGEITVAYSEVHNDGQGSPIKVPNLFAIGIPVFHGGAKYRIVCRLRYRLAGARVEWRYEIVNQERYFDDAMKDTVKNVQESTGVSVLFGAPEQG